MAYGTGSYGIGAYGADSSALYVSSAEVGALVDSTSQGTSFGASIVEAALANEVVSSTIISGLSVSEAGSLSDSQSSVTTYFLQAAEGGTFIDYISQGSVFSATFDDDATLSDWIASGQLFSKVQGELMALADSVDGDITVAIVMVLGTARVSDGPTQGSGVKLMNYYLLGSSVTLISAFADMNGLPVEPNEVSIEILQPDDTTVEISNGQITNLGGGVYTFSFQPTMTGIHFYRFTGQGSNSVVAEAYFLVQQSFN